MPYLIELYYLMGNHIQLLKLGEHRVHSFILSEDIDISDELNDGVRVAY